MTTRSLLSSKTEKAERPAARSPFVPAPKTMSGIARAMIEPGWMRLFGKKDLDTAGLVAGWSDPEETHVWNNGPSASFAVTTLVPPAGLRLSFEGGAFIASGCPRQDIALHVNGFYVGFWSLDHPDFANFEAILEPEHIFIRGDAAMLNIRWTLPHSARPSDLGHGSDSRALGFCFRSFALWLEH